MSKTIKISFIIAFILGIAAVLAVNPGDWDMPWDKTETAISQDSAEKARADKAEAELKKMKQEKAEADKKIAEAIESIERMQKMVSDMNQPPADQIATPVAPAPADSTTAVTPIAKKKSGVGG